MISKEYIEFFIDLAKNNNREWFQENRKRYEAHVKDPFKELVSRIAEKLHEEDESIILAPHKNTFRINRDIRFSPDKTPYNLSMKAAFSANGKKADLPGFYMDMAVEEVHIGGGLYMIPTPTLKKIRQYIFNNLDEFIEIIHEKKFVESFGEIQGNRAKRIDKDVKPALERTPYIANKQFYAMANFSSQRLIDNENIVEEINQYFEIVKPLNAFLKRAME